jgi:hypothetical protein
MAKKDKAKNAAAELLTETNPILETVKDTIPAKIKTKKKRLAKVIDGNILTIAEAVTETKLAFDVFDLPESIRSLLTVYGMSQKLGDAAAGKKGQEAVDAINKVWTGLSEGNWSVRAPAAEKISKKSILGKYAEMPDGEEKNLAGELLKKLGITLE